MTQRFMALTTVLLVASVAVGWAAVSADEPDPIVLVSNAEVDASLESTNFANDHAQEFTTGHNPEGYTVTGVRLAFALENPDGDPATFRVELWSLTGPGGSTVERLGTFENPETLTDPDASGSYFVAPEGGIKLQPRTNYLVLFDIIQQGSWSAFIRNVRSDHEDRSGEYRWSIYNTKRFRTQSQTGGGGTWQSWHNSLWLRVEGHEDRLALTASQFAATGQSEVVHVHQPRRSGSPCAGTPTPGLSRSESLGSVRLACDRATGEWVKVQLAVPGLDYALDRDLQQGNPDTNGCSAGQRYDPIRKTCLTYPPGR